MSDIIYLVGHSKRLSGGHKLKIAFQPGNAVTEVPQTLLEMVLQGPISQRKVITFEGVTPHKYQLIRRPKGEFQYGLFKTNGTGGVINDGYGKAYNPHEFGHRQIVGIYDRIDSLGEFLKCERDVEVYRRLHESTRQATDQLLELKRTFSSERGVLY